MSETAEAVVVVEDLKLHYPVRAGLLRREVGSIKAVDGVDLTVGKRETVGIVGETGSGKTTLGKCLVRLVTPTAGRIIFEGEDLVGVAGARLRSMRRHFQMIFQDPYASLTPHMKIADIVGEPLMVQGIVRSRDERASEVRRWLDLVGLSPQLGSHYPHELSGGQRQRVAIARALVLHPKLVVCDEPLSALDAVTQAKIADLLIELQRSFGLSYVLISHDVAAVRYLSDRINVMYLGQFVESAPAQELSDRPLHPYTRALWSAVPFSDPEREAKRERVILRGDIPSPLNTPSGCRFHSRCPYVIPGKCDTEEPPVIDAGGGHSVRCHLYT